MYTNYKYWSELEIERLVSSANRHLQPSNMVCWEKVARDMVPRTRQQCKSYFLQLRNTGKLTHYQKKTKQVQDVRRPEDDRKALEVKFQKMPREDKMMLLILKDHFGGDLQKVHNQMQEYNLVDIQFASKQIASTIELLRNHNASALGKVSNEDLRQWYQEMFLQFMNKTQISDGAQPDFVSEFYRALERRISVSVCFSAVMEELKLRKMM